MNKILLLLCVFALCSCGMSNDKCREIVYKTYPKYDIQEIRDYMYLVNDTSNNEIRLIKCMNLTNTCITSDYVIFKYK